MKPYISFSYLVLSIAPLAFWKMDGPFAQSINNDKTTLKDPIRHLEVYSDVARQRSRGPLSLYEYLYIYNDQTGYSISYMPKLFDQNIDVVKNFFISINAYTPYPEVDFILGSSQFYFCKEKPSLEQKDRTEPTEGTKLYSFFNKGRNEFWDMRKIVCEIEPKLSKELIEDNDFYLFINSLRKKQNIPEIPINPITLKEKFTTLSGVEVINQKDKVEIKKGEKIVDFQKALKKYFNYDKNKDIIIDAVNQSIPKDRTEKGQNLNSFDIGQAAFAIYTNVFPLLESSQILAVCAVINDEGRDSIIWGLAQDKKTEERFHWITKIKEEISVLFD